MRKATKCLIGLTFIIFWLNPFIGSAQSNEPIDVFGRIYSADSMFVSYAHIINLTTKKGTITNDFGNFGLTASNNDSIKIRSIAYKDTIFVFKDLLKDLANDNGVVIFLEKEVYQLKEVSVYSFTKEELMREALALEPLPYKKEDKFDMGYYTDMGRAPASGGFGLAINGPFTALYNAFSRKGKELTKYYALLERDAQEEKINRRYNASLVYRVTGLTDEKEIKDFMENCTMSNFFLENALDYDIVVAIIDCYKKYPRK